MSNLKPCPWCKSSNLTEESSACYEIAGVCYKSCYIECENCGAQGPIITINDENGKSNYQVVRDVWNNRAPPILRGYVTGNQW